LEKKTDSGFFKDYIHPIFVENFHLIFFSRAELRGLDPWVDTSNPLKQKESIREFLPEFYAQNLEPFTSYSLKVHPLILLKIKITDSKINYRQ